MKGVVIVFCLIFGLWAIAFATPEKKQVKINISEIATGYGDQTTVYFDLGLNSNYNTPEDAGRTFDSVTLMPQICSYSADGIPCSSNGFGTFSQTEIVEMGVKVKGDEQYRFSAAQLFNIDPASMVFLEDRQLHTTTDLRSGAYTLYIARLENTSHRFYLHVTYPPQLVKVDAGCDNNDGIIAVNQDSSVHWTYCRLYDSTYQMVGQINNQTGNINFGNLPGGLYNVVFGYNQYAATQAILLPGHQITADLSVSVDTGMVGVDIDFGVDANNASNYFWDFGDFGTATGVAHIPYAYYEPGTYEVVLRCTNSYGCTAYDTVTVYVLGPTGVNEAADNSVQLKAYGHQLKISVDANTGNVCSFALYDLKGSVLATQKIEGAEQWFDLSKLAGGTYIGTVTNGKNTVTRKISIAK